MLRNPVETILSWHNFHIRGIKNTPLDIKSFLRAKNAKKTIDLINFKKRINYFNKLKKNKLHVINYHAIKQDKIQKIFEKIMNKKLSYNTNNLRKQNSSIYFIKNLYIKMPWIKKLKFFLPRFTIAFMKNLLYRLNMISKIKTKNNEIEIRYLNKLFAKELIYYKSLFKGKDYFTLN